MLEEEANRIIITYQEIVTRQLCEAKDAGEMDAETFDRLIQVRCEAKTHKDIYDHFAGMFAEIIDYHKNKLLDRIEKGAAFIENLDPADPRYPKAVEKYEGLHERLQQQLDRENKSEEGPQ